MTTFRLAAYDSGVDTAAAPVLDEDQRRVVDHAGGPLLVLAGPGTGKTTTLIEAIVDRIERRGADPGSVLALTFSRKAAEQLRDRVTARLGRTIPCLATSLAATFHSFAYGLVRAHAPVEAYAAPLRLLSAAEQDVVLATLLRPEPESVPWPSSLGQARTTRGFSQEVQGLLARAREQGMGPAGLRAAGLQADRPEWVAAGDFMDQYLDILDAQSALDYPDLVARAVAVASRPRVRSELRERFRHVFVDEYQDTDPSQVALLQTLAGDGRDLVVVGDPDQSIYGFRGAELRGILEFPTTFPTGSGQPAPVVALGTTRRFGGTLLAASRRIARSLPAGGALVAETLAAFRSPRSVQGVAAGQPDEGTVEVLTFDTPRAETEHLADRLRRAHLSDGFAWTDMAVLVRSGRGSIPMLRRSLSAAGVPVEVAADETPLVREPAVLPLLDALRAVVDLDNRDPAHPDYIDQRRAQALLLSPLGGMDATEVRALARELRRRDRDASGAAPDRAPRPSAELVRAMLVDPGAEPVDHPAARKAARLAGLLATARRRLDENGTVEQVLWALWAGTSWPERLRRAALAGGGGALLAHRDLDAVCALFETAARAEERRGHTSVQTFLDTLTAQQIPADTLADRGVRGGTGGAGGAVRLLTAHRAKGLEWRLVVVAHVQEGGWPDLRRRSTLLHADELGADGALPPRDIRDLLAEERRLFYVACTRARQRLLVTAVASPDDDGEQPSRFLNELVDEPTSVLGRPPRPMSLDGVVAELRRTVADPAAAAGLREAAVRRLADLALAVDPARPDRPLVPHADPATWWGTRGRSLADRPLRQVDQPVVVSASTLERILECPAKWFLEREAGGETKSTAAQGFGLLVHTLADRVAKGELTDVDELMEHVDRVWSQLAFRTPWSAAKERAEVRAALDRFLAWHHRPDARTVIGTEEKLEAEVRIGGERIVLRGFADRLELDQAGAVVVVDFKTGKYPPTDKQVPTNPQLGLYQLAVEHGAADHLLDGAPVRSGGAELVHLRKQAHGSVKVQSQQPQHPGESGLTPVEEQIAQAVGRIRSERFPARAGEQCQRCGFRAICPIQGAGTVLS